ncbi:flagellar protein FlaG [Polaromonas sp.]|uniref:flagellar protein FlaG n=1 Tax=Polaromonas sp. TaxID=1869339 RepID=UPI0035682AFE
MTVSVSALSASPRREPAMVVPATPQAPKQAERMREAVPLEREKKTAESTPEQTNAALAEINRSFQLASVGVRFEFDKETDKVIAKVVDVETGQVIRQMPSEAMVQVSKALDRLQGLLLSQKI